MFNNHITPTYDRDPRRLQPLKDAVNALREEAELEAVVDVVGGPEAQQAVYEHRLPALVDSIR